MSVERAGVLGQNVGVLAMTNSYFEEASAKRSALNWGDGPCSIVKQRAIHYVYL